MTPQSPFMVLAPILAGREPDLRALLATMNRQPGIADPHNLLVPFGEFEQLHFARFVVLDDKTLGDRDAYDAPFPNAPVYLAFLGDCDGPAEAMLTALVDRAASGLTRIFSHCEGFDAADLRRWMADHSVAPTTQYVNWAGRRTGQVREEAALHAALGAELAAHPPAADEPPQHLRERLQRAIETKGPALTPIIPPPKSWVLREILHFLGGALFLLVLAPIVLVASPVLLVLLRRRETSDPVIVPRPARDHVHALAEREDHDVTNSFSALGSIKPGIFRLSIVLFVLWLLNFAARHVYNRGHLARVGTIHFARWVLLDDKRRLLFASNYDSSLEAYMDDFINKAGFGLNLVFSNGVGYPRTRFLLFDGAGEEQQFKAFLRRHQHPTDVWYKAYPGLTAFDLARNGRIREGLERDWMSDDDVLRWLALI
jgi:hypothetical protein